MLLFFLRLSSSLSFMLHLPPCPVFPAHVVGGERVVVVGLTIIDGGSYLNDMFFNTTKGGFNKLL